MLTVDVRKMAYANEILVTVQGATNVPVVIDLDTGANKTLRGARIEANPWAATVFDCHPDKANAYWGELPVRADTLEARLTLVADGVARNMVARWEPDPPEPAVQPAPAPRKRRARRTA
jgi:hypothetical protein